MRFATGEDKALIESIVNDPRIRPWSAYDGAPPCEASVYLRPPNFTVLASGGCFLAILVRPGRYMVHTNLLPILSGAQKLRAAREALEFAFVRTDMRELVTLAPACNPQAGWFARAMGMRKRFTRARIFPAAGMRWDVDFFSLDIHDWIVGSQRCRELGAQFHAQMKPLREGHRQHPDDDVHNRYAGFVAMLIEAGVSPQKAIDIYNEWAPWAFYDPVSLLSTDPVRIDIRSCVVVVRDRKLSVEEPVHA